MPSGPALSHPATSVLRLGPGACTSQACSSSRREKPVDASCRDTVADLSPGCVVCSLCLLGPVLRPHSLMPSLFTWRFTILLLGCLGQRDFGGKTQPHIELFLPSRAGAALGQARPLPPHLPARPTSLPVSSVPPVPELPGLRGSAQVPCLAPSPSTHSCNPVTTTGDITHSWPGSQ